MKETSESVLRLPLQERAELAFNEAVEKAIEEHVRLGLPIYVGRNGKVVALSAQDLGVNSPTATGEIEEEIVRDFKRWRRRERAAERVERRTT